MSPCTRSIAALVAAFFACAGPVAAQTFPSKPIRLVVPYGPGASTDTMGRMHSDAQFAGSSSVPAHVEMMGFLGMGNNPMVGATVAVAVAVEQSLKN